MERFFALLTEKQIRRGVHRSVTELEAAITAFLDKHNADPKPFRWIKSADDILAVERFCVYNTPATCYGGLGPAQSFNIHPDCRAASGSKFSLAQRSALRRRGFRRRPGDAAVAKSLGCRVSCLPYVRMG